MALLRFPERETAGTANRSLAVLSSTMKRAEDLELRSEWSNPCRSLQQRKTGFKAP